MRYLAMMFLSTAALGMDPQGQYVTPQGYGPRVWEYGQLSDSGASGWFLVRHARDGGSLVFAEDQPSGRKEPSFVHYGRPASARRPQGPSGFLTGQAAANGVMIGQMTGLAGHGPMVITDGSAKSDAAAARVMEEAAAHTHEGPCNPDNPRCPNRPDPDPEPEPDEPDEPAPSPLDPYRRFFVPAALLGIGALIAHRIKKARESLA